MYRHLVLQQEPFLTSNNNSKIQKFRYRPLSNQHSLSETRTCAGDAKSTHMHPPQNFYLGSHTKWMQLLNSMDDDDDEEEEEFEDWL